MHKFARIASPLSEILCKFRAKDLGHLTEEKIGGLETHNEKSISRPVLTLPNSNGHNTLDTNESGRQVVFNASETG